MGLTKFIQAFSQDHPKVDVKRRRLVAGSVIAALGMGSMAFANAQPPQAGAAEKKYKAIVHVTDGEPEKWNRVLNFVRGIQGELKDNVAIEMVISGLAIGMLKADSPAAKGVSDAIASGVQVAACEYTMKVLKVGREQINSSVSYYVPVGGVEIIKRQGEDWAYLRP